MTDASRPVAAPAPASATPVAPAPARNLIDGPTLGLLVTMSVLWGVNWPMMKPAVIDLGPWMFRAICLLIAVIGMLILVRATGERMRLPPRALVGPLILASAINVTLWHVLTGFGLAYMAAGRAGIIAYLMPVISTVLAAPMLGEKLTWRKIVALFLGAAGLAVLIWPEIGRIGGDLRGPLLMLGSAFAWAFGTMLIKGRRWGYSPAQLTTWQMLIGTPPLVILALLLAPLPDPAQVTAMGWIGLIYASTVAMVWCHYTWYRILDRLPASIASISTLAIPAVGVIASAILLGEPLGFTEFAALTLVLGAITIVIWPKSAG
ncbi:drug/metabolite transporter (DMT)-like permease [Stella humosa]|uniref:Drug/metabolite transporter (DMT)-like permease n=2 Tax=Stella humosa TaxID=94 RepID=A0A3N1KZJ7_9PROT|nr:DMT family transporter [Stella humosa]ROP83626.1 drug/metabolite transporter (DMT)-like permease [Stella humosa]